MQFLYHQEAGASRLILEGQAHRHVYLSRRTPLEQVLTLRNLQDHKLYSYKPIEVHKRHAVLSLQSIQDHRVQPKHKTHLIWAIIHLKSIEKVLAYLNQMGVDKISFFYATFSQQTLDAHKLERLKKILIASCEQSGRSILMDLEVFPDIQEVLNAYPSACVFDFGGTNIRHNKSLEQGIIIGPEGGFSPQERELLASREIYSTPNPLILTSEASALFLGALGSS